MLFSSLSRATVRGHLCQTWRLEKRGAGLGCRPGWGKGHGDGGDCPGQPAPRTLGDGAHGEGPGDGEALRVVVPLATPAQRLSPAFPPQGRERRMRSHYPRVQTKACLGSGAWGRRGLGRGAWGLSVGQSDGMCLW